MDLLTITFADLYKMVLEYQGKKRETTDADDLRKAKQRTNDGYAAMLLAYDWYWLRKGMMLTTKVGVDGYNLPDDFSMFKSPPTNPTSSVFPWPTAVDDETLVKYQAITSSVGVPYYYSITNKFTAETGIVHVIRFYPTPSDIINYVYTYRPVVEALVNNLDRPYAPPELTPLLKGFV